MDPRRFIKTAARLLVLAAFGLSVTFGQEVLVNRRLPFLPVSGCTVATGDILAENFEGTGYDEVNTGDWTEPAGTPSEDTSLPGTSPCSGLGSQCLFTDVTTSTEYSLFDTTANTTATRYFRVYFYVDSHGLAVDENMHIVDARDTGGTRAFTVRLTNVTGEGLGVDILGTTFSGNLNGLSLDTWFRMEIKWVRSGTGATELKVFDAAGTQVDSTVTCNTDTTQFRKVALGVFSNPASKAANIYWDGFGISSTGYLGQ